MSDATPQTLEAVIAVAREAGRLQLARRGERLAEIDKDGGGSFATAVDYACEQVILDALRPRFPHHRFIAEESGATGLENAEHTWAIDPLDGTTAYVSGQPYFAVSIGLLHRGTPVLGVIYLPEFGRMYSALRGAGAFRDGARIRVSTEAEMRRASLGFDLGAVGIRAEEVRRLYLPVVDTVRFAYVFGGAAANLAFVADGTLDGYAHTASLWDYAAGAVLVEEAGGKITDYAGRTLSWSGSRFDLVATNGRVHEALLSRLAHAPGGVT
jgi:myo-inositol-1(or 4)-monophosphatase